MSNQNEWLSSRIEECLKKSQSSLEGDAVSGETTHVAYGTAGFRGQADKIKHIFTKVGIITGLRCLVQRANVGIMITASHNPIQDNGVKLIDSKGEMLATNWEPIVERFCNLGDDAILLADEVMKISRNHNLELEKLDTHIRNSIYIGFDTRPSSIRLKDLVCDGLDVWSSHVDCIMRGLITTPALHFLVAESNKRARDLQLTEYYMKLVDGVLDLILNSKSTRKQYNPTELIVDCANGVGSETLKYMCNNQKFVENLPIKLINAGDGTLNLNCGADFVKTTLKAPTGAHCHTKRYASLDGDADRLIYFYLEPEPNQHRLRLLDGDKIMALYATYLRDALERANLDGKLSFGIIQTAYANGASTDYLEKQLGIKVDFVDTGVKNLHHKALNYDFAIYFEANGHGTIWVSENARQSIETLPGDLSLELKRLLNVLNNYTGDAISDMLIVEAILDYKDLHVRDWYNFYQDRPNSLTKVRVNDRRLVKTTNAGRTCLEPIGLQDEIDKLSEQFSPKSRCFVRASGTEDVVRIYAEATTQEKADKLADLVGNRVVQICNT